MTHTLDSLSDRIYPEPMSGCWLWIGMRSEKGYGTVWAPFPTTLKRAHRLIYESEVGTIAPNHDLHHVCGVRSCVNPRHLVQMTHEEHLALTHSIPKEKKTAPCPHGHSMTGDNLVFYNGNRFCRECSRRRSREYSRKRRAAKWIR